MTGLPDDAWPLTTNEVLLDDLDDGMKYGGRIRAFPPNSNCCLRPISPPAAEREGETSAFAVIPAILAENFLVGSQPRENRGTQ